jgi:hypothetical protein
MSYMAYLLEAKISIPRCQRELAASLFRCYTLTRIVFRSGIVSAQSALVAPLSGLD